MSECTLEGPRAAAAGAAAGGAAGDSDSDSDRHHGKPRVVMSPFLAPLKNPAAKRLEDWIAGEESDALPREGGGGKKCKGQVVQVVLPETTGCGYKFVMDTYSQCFADLKLTVDDRHPRGRYPDVEMTPQWLHDNIFKPGESFDAMDLGLS